jgi:adenylosuccinate lyase
LVDGGLSRDDAYRIVQRNAMRAWDERTDFRSLLEADPDVDNSLLDEAFDLSRSLRHLDVVFDQLDAIVMR